MPTNAMLSAKPMALPARHLSTKRPTRVPKFVELVTSLPRTASGKIRRAELQQVRQFILSNYLFTDDESKLVDAESLMQNGTMDSTGILELIMFLEETFGIKVGDDEMIPTNLDSVVNVVSFVERKQAA